eukprot:CAMPEP_0171479430 /NCGR_PEP_ID=MMETSP0946-20130122/5424_1 /TAXON_ID=109269 /ORGANISM="Vaucheria litorea, Strain CCMP2940" /LENGTH=191 /DNA_ID=CAMNT_0012010367 /DNA_START=141 /DNA_END=719 /DNA_ORIENTATION=-
MSQISLEKEEIDPGVISGLEIVKYPHPSLRNKNEEVTKFDSDLKALSKKMFDLMYASNGVGLAAPQVGVNKRLMVFNPDGDSVKWLSEITLVNPKIIEKSKSEESENEGCLSFPGIRGTVSRSKWIKVEAMNTKGGKIKKKFEGWEARIFQHEYDHLDGVVFTDRFDGESKDNAKARLDELINEFGEGGRI